MEMEKWIGKSQTVLSGIVMFVIAMLPVIKPYIGLDVTPDDVQGVGSAITDVLTSVGAFVMLIFNIRGRMRANTKLTLGVPKNPAE